MFSSEGFLSFNAVIGDSDDRDAFFSQFGIFISKRTALLGAAGGVRFWVKINKKVGRFCRFLLKVYNLTVLVSGF